MKLITVTHINGIALTTPLDKAVNLKNFIRWYQNADGFVVARYDVSPGTDTDPESYTLDISKAIFDAIIAVDTAITTVSLSVYNLNTGVTTTTAFNEKYIATYRDTDIYISGVSTAVLEMNYMDGSFISKKVYANTDVLTLLADNEAEILTYAFAAVSGSTTSIDSATRTITGVVPKETSLSALVATFTTSDNIDSIKVGGSAQTSGATANNFGSPKTYVVVAEDAVTTRNWVVSVTNALGALAVISTFTIASESGSTTIDGSAGTIALTMPFGTDPSALVPTFSASAGSVVTVGAVAQTSAVTANDFTGDVTYTVTSEDGATVKEYVVTVTIALS